MIFLPDDDLSGGGLLLRVALEAQIRVPLHQQFRVDRSVRRMTGHAPLPQCFVFEDKRARLLAMTRGAGLIEPRHRQTARRFEDFLAVRIVALHTIHSVLYHRMMVREIELGVRLDVALKTTRRILSGIHNEPALSTADPDVFASGAVTRFASGHRRRFQVVPVKSRVRTGRKNPRNVRVAFGAGPVANEMRALDMRRGDRCLAYSGTGANEQTDEAQAGQRASDRDETPVRHGN